MQEWGPYPTRPGHRSGWTNRGNVRPVTIATVVIYLYMFSTGSGPVRRSGGIYWSTSSAHCWSAV